MVLIGVKELLDEASIPRHDNLSHWVLLAV